MGGPYPTYTQPTHQPDIPPSTFKNMSVKPKEQHKKVLDNIIEQKANGELVNLGKAIRKAGYSETVANNPKIVTETKGFQALLRQKLPDVDLVDMLKTDLSLKEGNRLGELKLAFDLLGHTTNKVDVNITKEVDDSLAAMKAIIDNAGNEEEDSTT